MLFRLDGAKLALDFDITMMVRNGEIRLNREDYCCLSVWSNERDSRSLDASLLRDRSPLMRIDEGCCPALHDLRPYHHLKRSFDAVKML